jgi:hypothetical protein
MQARKLIKYHFVCLLSFETHGIASIARPVQREEVSLRKQEHEDLVGFVRESTWALHPLLNFDSFFVIVQMLIVYSKQIHCKSIYFLSTWHSFRLLPVPHENGIFVRVAGFVAILTIFSLSSML